MRCGFSRRSGLLLAGMLSLNFCCRQDAPRPSRTSPEDSIITATPFPTFGASPPPHLQELREALALDSTDVRILQAWTASRHAAQQGTFTNWMKENYWPLQSIGLRLVEQAHLELEQERVAVAQAKLDSVARIAEDLATQLQDHLLRTHCRKVQQWPAEARHRRTAMMVATLQGRELTEQHEYPAATRVLQDALQAAWQLGDSLSAAEIWLAQLALEAAQEEYARLAHEGDKATALAQKIGYHSVHGQMLNQIADAERVLGHDTRALLCATQAGQIAERLHDRRLQRDSQLYRARIYYDQEEYRAAESALAEVMALDPERQYLGDVLLLQAQMSADRGEYGLAKGYLDRAVPELKKSQEAADVAAAYSTLALLHMEQGEDRDALDAERQALHIHQQTKNARRVGWSYMNLGWIYTRFDSLAQADSALTQAIAHMRETQEPRALAHALTLLGNVQVRRGNYSAAAKTFTEARAWASGVAFRYGEAGVELGQARLALAQNATASADSHLTQAVNIARALREPQLLTQIYFQRGLLEKQRPHEAAALDFLEQAIATLEQRFYSIAVDSSRMQFFAPAHAIFDEAILLALALHQDERALGLAERARARALLESVGTAARQTALTSMPVVPAVRQVQQVLPAKSQVVIYRVTPACLLAWTIGKSTFSCRRLALRRAALADSVQRFRASLGAVETATFSERVEQNPLAVYQENRFLGRGLYRMLVDSLFAAASGNETVYLIPDGPLHHLPFGALVNAQQRFWEEECVLLRAPSLALLYLGLRSPRVIPPMASNRILVVSNPAGDFPAAEEEQAALAALFPQHQVLQRERASFAAVHDRTQSGTDILHLSVHAYADPLRPLNSYMELSAPGANAAALHTERVFARQLLEMKLPEVWLIFLNGCETATGRIVYGEGALNLVRLFALQHVALVAATLWKNDDWQSLPIVASFYRRLVRETDPALALHRAKLEAIAELSQHSRERVALPYFWAVFEMYFNQRVVYPSR